MAVKKNRGLGRGLDALLPEAEDFGASVQELDIGDIDPNPEQPRRSFSEESIQQLAQSIRDQGVLQPLLVVATDGGRYRIVAGERRWRAARAAGLERVPCMVRDLDEKQQMEIALIENLQREDLNPLETAQGIRALMQQFGYTQEQVAQRLAKSRPAVTNALRLLTLPDEVTGLIASGVLSAGHARVLAGMDDQAKQIALARETVERGYSVRELEAIAAAERAEQNKPPRVRPPRVLTAELNELQSRIRQTIGMRVTLTGSEKKGRIVLQYTTRDELERLNDLLARMEEN